MLTLRATDKSQKSESEIILTIVDGSIVKLEAPWKVECLLGKNLSVSLALDDIHARIGDVIQLRSVIWKDKLPLDALPAEGAIDIPVLSEEMLESQAVGEHWSA